MLSQIKRKKTVTIKYYLMCWNFIVLKFEILNNDKF